LTIEGLNAGLDPSNWVAANDVTINRISSNAASLTIDGVEIDATTINGVGGPTWNSILFEGDTNNTLTVKNSILTVDATASNVPVQAFGFNIASGTGNITIDHDEVTPFTGVDPTESEYGAWINGYLDTTRDVSITNSSFDVGNYPDSYSLAFDGQQGGSHLTVTGNTFGDVHSAAGAIRMFDFENVLSGQVDYSGISGNTFSNPPGNNGLMTNETNFQQVSGNGATVIFGANTYSDGTVLDSVVNASDAPNGQTLTPTTSGRNLVIGSPFDDTFNLDSGNNIATGGGGLDTAHFSSTLTAASFSFSNNEWVVTNGANTDDLIGISLVTDGAGDTFLLVGGGSQYTSAAQAKSSAQFQVGDVVLGPSVVTPVSANAGAASNEMFAASALFTATDTEGNTILQYQVEDTSTGASQGFWTLNGIVKPNGAPFIVSAAQLSGLSFTAGSNASGPTVDTLEVAAADAGGFGTSATFTVTAAAHAPNDVAPTVSALIAQALPESVLAASSVFSGSVPQGQNIVGYEVQDTNGDWVFNGTPVAANQIVDVTAPQLSQLTLNTGFGTDTLMVRANDGVQWGNLTTIQITQQPNAAPPANTAADMILVQNASGIYEVYDVGTNTILAAAPLDQISTSLEVVGIGGFDGNDSSDMLARNNTTGGLTLYDVSNNNVTGNVNLGQVGLEWTVSGFGDFSSHAGETDMLMQNSHTGAFEVYDISNNAITNATGMGQVGLEWTVAGFGDFSGRIGETGDMLMRNSNTGAFELYDISNNTITSAAGMGQVGLEWQVAGFGDFSGRANETDMLMRNSNTGAFELYDISNNTITNATGMGQVGLEWQIAGFGDFSGHANETDMLMRNSNTGAFELYDIGNNTITNATGMGQVGLEWSVSGFGGSTGAPPNTQLAQAMASFAPSSSGPAASSPLAAAPTVSNLPTVLAGTNHL
jgi:hypothetical protein